VVLSKRQLAAFIRLILRSIAKRCVSKDGAAHPISGSPEIEELGAQVGYSRLAMFETRSFGALLTMRPSEVAACCSEDK
jgi:hypothetical protein